MTFSEIVGRAADKLQSYGEQPVTPGRWQAFVPPESLTKEPAGVAEESERFG